jgi:broad specificity phosphatase PhoE/ribonuclease HI
VSEAAGFDRVVVEADGGSRGNPGPAGYGAVVMADGTGEVLAERSEYLGTVTNNVAEYRGLIAGLEAALELGARIVAVRMDSKLVVEQMSGRWQVKHEAMRPLARRASELRREFAEVTFTWIPRERNKHADRLANAAMDQGTGRPPKAASSAAAASAAAVQEPLWAPVTGAATRLVLVRHGATAHSAEHRLSGHNDLPLDAAGTEQADALARRLPALGPFAAIVCSPLTRARQTAEAISERLRLAVSVDKDWAEVDFGEWDGLTSDEARAGSPEHFAAWSSSFDAAPPGGESFAALARRVRRARDRVVTAHAGATVLVVTHVTPIKLLVRAALDAPERSVFRMHLDLASISRVDYFADGQASLRRFNDVAHLGG